MRFLQRGNSSRNNPATLTKKPKSTSPSAWALSPGRPLPLFGNVIPADQSPAVGGKRGKVVKRGGMSGVLKFFRQKKVSPTMEDEFHKFRVLHNRLLQWRFANAKAEANLSSLTALARDRLFHVWLRLLNVRSVIVEKRIEIQKIKQDMKLIGIVNNHITLLNVWEKLERKNCEALSRITRKASALSVKLPLVDNAKGEVECIYKAMKEAMEVMGNIVATLTNFFSQVEKNLYLVTELTTTLQHQEECLMEMETIVTFVALLFAREKSVRAQVIQETDIFYNESSSLVSPPFMGYKCSKNE